MDIPLNLHLDKDGKMFTCVSDEYYPWILIPPFLLIVVTALIVIYT